MSRSCPGARVRLPNRAISSFMCIGGCTLSFPAGSGMPGSGVSGSWSSPCRASAFFRFLSGDGSGFRSGRLACARAVANQARDCGPSFLRISATWVAGWDAKVFHRVPPASRNSSLTWDMISLGWRGMPLQGGLGPSGLVYVLCRRSAMSLYFSRRIIHQASAPGLVRASPLRVPSASTAKL